MALPSLYFLFQGDRLKNSKMSVEKRITVVLIAFLLFACYLLINVLRLDLFMYDYYLNKTYDQITTSSTLPAKRGSIYDANMNLLATSDTVWRVFVSPREIKTHSRENNFDYASLIAEGLSSVLDISKDRLYKKITESNVLDVTLKGAIDEDTYRKTLQFIKTNSLEELVFTESKSMRYYPEGILAAHVLGFTGSDNQGLYGLEYYYEDILRGIDGYYLYAKDATGNALNNEYSTYVAPTDGSSLITTIDSYIQSELEAIVETARSNHGAENRVAGIVMNTETGAILAMATSGAFDPNEPFVLDEFSAKKLADSGYSEGSDEYKKYKTELLELMWSNKAVSEIYEPGSTFKIATVSAALDSGAVSLTDTFSCPGYREVGGWRIRCHKTTGHGSGFNLAYGLQMSCNPCMISIAEKMGSETFYNYVQQFGYLEKTGIDLPSEAIGIFHKPESIGPTELATSSFGQRFKVSIINQLTAIAAVANGGILLKPYVVDRIINANGETVYKHETEIKRRVISEDVANAVSEILIDGVNGNGGAKNAAVEGYDIAAKTGTSQKFDILDSSGNSYLRIGSTVAYSQDEERGVATIIVVDEPTSTVKYGSVVAAPYVSMLMERVLPYLEFISSAESVNIKVENYVGQALSTVERSLRQSGIGYETVGDGDNVIAQTPLAGEIFTYPIGKIILYTTETSKDTVTVPELYGKTLAEAIKLATASGLNVKLAGAASSPDSDDRVSEQSLKSGEKVRRGSVITIRAIKEDYAD